MNASSFHYSWHLLFYILCKMWEALPQVISLNWIWVNISHTLKRSLYHNLFFIYFFTTEINKISLRILKKIRIFRPSWQFCDSYYFFFLFFFLKPTIKIFSRLCIFCRTLYQDRDWEKSIQNLMLLGFQIATYLAQV